jgi:hypothetical protein
VCTGYKNPASLDPRLLDPAHVFRQLEVETPDKRPSIFDKVFEGRRRRRRNELRESARQGSSQKAQAGQLERL